MVPNRRFSRRQPVMGGIPSRNGWRNGAFINQTCRRKALISGCFWSFNGL